MVLRRILFSFLALFAFTTLQAQRSSVVYAEGLGNGLIYSVNFDTRILNRPDGPGIRLGGNVLKAGGGDFVTFIPMQVNYVFGTKHGLELGVGMTYSYQKESTAAAENYLFANACVMYRYQAPKGFNFRIGWAPIFAPEEAGALFSTKWFWLFPGVSVGYKF
jgi:hypothetical protein